MKTLLSILCCVVAVGCGCSTTQRMPLQPGESVIFQDADRANHFRQVSANDPTNLGRVVRITQPTRLEYDAH